jgi:hypothetical protein
MAQAICIPSEQITRGQATDMMVQVLFRWRLHMSKALGSQRTLPVHVSHLKHAAPLISQLLRMRSRFLEPMHWYSI